jgi:hypothetical protein
VQEDNTFAWLVVITRGIIAVETALHIHTHKDRLLPSSLDEARVSR